MIPVYDLRLVRARKPLRIAEGHANCAAQAAYALHSLIGMTDREHFACLFVNGRNAIVGAHIIAIGGSSSIFLDPRTVFRAAIVGQAHALILGHNHPSGDPSPSPDDLRTTRDLAESGRTLALPVLDHVIVTRDASRWKSLRDAGLMPDLLAPGKEVRST
jgi:DNA repair protein RadC